MFRWFRKLTGDFFKEESEIHFFRSRDTNSPQRGTSLSAGLDVYVPNDFPITVLYPGQSALIPAGLHVSFDPKYVLIAFNKSGIAAKKKLLIGAQVIDADYQGEIHVNVHNVGLDCATITPGDKITQFILLPVELASPVEVHVLSDLYESNTERGEGGFGSTGTR